LIPVFLVVLTGCRAHGPGTIRRDRFDYAAALADSAKAQMLMNIVRMRYLDQPIFLDVQSVIAGYNWEHTGNAKVVLKSPFSSDKDSAELGYSGKYVERPTISYSPVDGSEFINGILTPVQPNVVVLLISSGWPAGQIFESMVFSVNGERNFHVLRGKGYPPEVPFTRFVHLLRDVQFADALSVSVKRTETEVTSMVLRFHTDRMTAEDRRGLDEVRDLLRLSRETDTDSIQWGAASEDPAVIAIQTRSVLHLIHSLTWYVDVPPEHIERGIAPPLEPATEAAALKESRLMRIHSGSEPPPDAYAAVRYRNTWFWIDTADSSSKRTFGYLTLLLTLMQSEGEAGPRLVISTN